MVHPYIWKVIIPSDKRAVIPLSLNHCFSKAADPANVHSRVCSHATSVWSSCWFNWPLSENVAFNHFADTVCIIAGQRSVDDWMNQFGNGIFGLLWSKIYQVEITVEMQLSYSPNHLLRAIDCAYTSYSALYCEVQRFCQMKKECSTVQQTIQWRHRCTDDAVIMGTKSRKFSCCIAQRSLARLEVQLLIDCYEWLI